MALRSQRCHFRFVVSFSFQIRFICWCSRFLSRSLGCCCRCTVHLLACCDLALYAIILKTFFFLVVLFIYECAFCTLYARCSRPFCCWAETCDEAHLSCARVSFSSFWKSNDQYLLNLFNWIPWQTGHHFNWTRTHCIIRLEDDLASVLIRSLISAAALRSHLLDRLRFSLVRFRSSRKTEMANERAIKLCNLANNWINNRKLYNHINHTLCSHLHILIKICLINHRFFSLASLSAHTNIY